MKQPLLPEAKTGAGVNFSLSIGKYISGKEKNKRMFKMIFEANQHSMWKFQVTEWNSIQ